MFCSKQGIQKEGNTLLLTTNKFLKINMIFPYFSVSNFLLQLHGHSTFTKWLNFPVS